MSNSTLQKILVVDDEEEVLAHLSNILKRANYEVVSTTRGKEAVELAMKLKPDLIVLDLVLTDIDGLQVCKCVKKDQATKDIPVIIMTGFGTDYAEEKSRDYGADDFIKKPYDAKDLLVKIKTLLRVKELFLSTRKKILLVDDDPKVLEMIRLRLEESNYKVITASNGREALNELTREKPDAVLLDILMPELDGLNVLERIRKEDKALPVFIITEFSNEELPKLAKRLNASGFIVKTRDLKKEVESITNVL